MMPVRRAAMRPTFAPGGAQRGVGRVPDVLVVAASVGVLDGVHGAATDLRPAIPLHLELVVVVPRLEHGLVGAAAARHDADDGAAGGADGLARPGGQPQARLLAVVGVPHQDAGAPAGTGDRAAIGGLVLHHGEDCPLGDLV